MIWHSFNKKSVIIFGNRIKIWKKLYWINMQSKPILWLHFPSFNKTELIAAKLTPLLFLLRHKIGVFQTFIFILLNKVKKQSHKKLEFAFLWLFFNICLSLYRADLNPQATPVILFLTEELCKKIENTVDDKTAQGCWGRNALLFCWILPGFKHSMSGQMQQNRCFFQPFDIEYTVLSIYSIHVCVPYLPKDEQIVLILYFEW